MCPPLFLIEREGDKQVEQLAVGTNHLAISAMRQRLELEGKGLNDNSEKEQEVQKECKQVTLML